MRFPLRKMNAPAADYIIPQCAFGAVVVAIFGVTAAASGVTPGDAIFFALLMMLMAFLACYGVSMLLFWLDVKYGYFLINEQEIIIVKFGFIRKTLPLENVKKLQIYTTKYSRRNIINWTGDVVVVYDKTFLFIKFWFSYDQAACDLISEKSKCRVVDSRRP